MNFVKTVGIFAVLILSWSESCVVAVQEQPQSKLWYNKPAKIWETEALPLGNGRLGCMVFGGVDQERIQFNVDSLWVGDEQDTGRYQAFGDLFIELKNQKGVPTGEQSAYRRELDIGNAVHKVEYEFKGTRFTREYFASRPAEVLVFKLSADKPGQYSGKIRLTSPINTRQRSTAKATRSLPKAH